MLYFSYGKPKEKEETMTSLKLAIATIMLATVGLSPTTCESCGEICLAENLETHVFEEWHEFDHGTEIIAYVMDICPTCVEQL